MSLPARRAILRLVAFGALSVPSIASAHDARPLSITIVEQATHVYRVVVRIPPTVEAANAPRIAWPDSCELIEGTEPGQALLSTSMVRCADGLAMQSIRIGYPYYNPAITTLVRLQTIDGAPLSAVLPPDVLEWSAPAEPTLLAVAGDYIQLGIRHIWAGPDHLLFVAGLLLLARRPRRIFWAITGFTAAHSITLSLATLGLVRFAVAPVEAMIALSILLLASEIARADAASFSRRFPIALSFVFGLLHGFGFAGALGEIGLPRTEIAAGLLFFNLGVELGQLAFIALIIGVTLTARVAAPALNQARGLSSSRATALGAYCLGVPAAFWFLQRTTAVFGLY